jgi:hypothetical protein
MTKVKRVVWIFPVFVLVSVGLVIVATEAHAAEPEKRWGRIGEPGDFVMSLAQDRRGDVWIGTEDKGIWRYRASAEVPNHIKQFTTKDGLGDDNGYAILCEDSGRVWIGTQSHGVSVFDGERWRNFGVKEGPIGERIFALTRCPTDGDIWMATSAGLTRYLTASDKWRHYTTADGLPELQANSLAFTPSGDLVVGAQTQGVGIALRKNEYRKWDVSKGPTRLTTDPSGNGLPSSLINKVVVATEDLILAGTCAGLGFSKDKGKSWKYIRGRDYAEKVRRRTGGAPNGWQECRKEVMDALLPEDYITDMSLSAEGDVVWVAFRQRGFAILNLKTMICSHAEEIGAKGLPEGYVTNLLASTGETPLVATYGKGLLEASKNSGLVTKKRESRTNNEKLTDKIKMPSPSFELPDHPKEKTTRGNIIPSIADDWRTKGDFYGKNKLRNYRYGELHAQLCAFCSPFDAVWGREGIACSGRLGTHCAKDDALRNWVHWNETDDVRSLKNPYEDKRRQFEWDDHGEAYPLTHEGPHVYVHFKLPKGTYYVSLYFFNKDGHEDNNRLRDFLLTAKEGWTRDLEFLAKPVIAKGRVMNFWGGVYKRFVLPGDKSYTIEIHDNWSFNTIVSGVFFDAVTDSAEYRESDRAVPRVRYALQRGDVRVIESVAKENGDEELMQLSSLVKQLVPTEGEELPEIAGNGRKAAQIVLRQFSENAPKNLPPKVLLRIKAECCRALNLHDERDYLYSQLDKDTTEEKKP